MRNCANNVVCRLNTSYLDVSWEHPQYTDHTVDYVLAIRQYGNQKTFKYANNFVVSKDKTSAIVPVTPVPLNTNTKYQAVVQRRRQNGQQKYIYSTYNGDFNKLQQANIGFQKRRVRSIDVIIIQAYSCFYEWVSLLVDQGVPEGISSQVLRFTSVNSVEWPSIRPIVLSMHDQWVILSFSKTFNYFRTPTRWNSVCLWPSLVCKLDHRRRPGERFH